MEIKTTLRAGYGYWIAAHAVGHDGSEAHTSPIYVSRTGFRHWNIDQAEQLIDKQLAILDEVQAALDDSRRAVAGRANPLDYWNKLNADQANMVQERLDRSRREYEQLRTKLAAEQIARQ